MAGIVSAITQGNNDKVEMKSQVNLNGQAFPVFKQFKEQFTTDIQAVKITEKNIGGTGGIYDNANFAVYGVSRYASTSTTSFVLGNAQAAILGTSKLGETASTPVVSRVVSPNDLFVERFFGTNFIDSSSTAEVIL